MKSNLTSILMTIGVVLMLIAAYIYLFRQLPKEDISSEKYQEAYHAKPSASVSQLPVYKPSYSSRKRAVVFPNSIHESDKLTGTLNNTNNDLGSEPIGVIPPIDISYALPPSRELYKGVNYNYYLKGNLTHWQKISRSSVTAPFSGERRELAQNIEISSSRPQRVGGDTDPGEPGLPVGDEFHFLLCLAFIYGGMKHFISRK